jgi:hypothetical protein
VCKKEITELIEFGKLAALTDEQRALVVEACLGYYILNEPPAELVFVVREVSNQFIDLIASSKVDFVAAARYICSLEGAYYGVIEQSPSKVAEVAKEQVLAALHSSSIAVQLNAHRTLVKYITSMESYTVLQGPTGRTRKVISYKQTKTDRYGAVGMMGDVDLTPTAQTHVPASLQNTTEGGPHPYDMPGISGPSGTTGVLLKVARGLKLTRSDERWYCLGILGFLLAPGAHSLHEVARTIEANMEEDPSFKYTPCYRYCGFLGFEMQRAHWYKPMLLKFGSSVRFGYWGDLEILCYDLVKRLLTEELWSLVFSFLEIPFLPSSSWSGYLQKRQLTL